MENNDYEFKLFFKIIDREKTLYKNIKEYYPNNTSSDNDEFNKYIIEIFNK